MTSVGEIYILIVSHLLWYNAEILENKSGPDRGNKQSTPKSTSNHYIYKFSIKKI